jgi:hypothetical protein
VWRHVLCALAHPEARPISFITIICPAELGTARLNKYLSFVMESSNPNFKPTLFETIFIKIFHVVNFFIPWHRLPGLIGAFNLDFMRVELRNYNLHDGYASADAQGKVGELPATEKRYVGTRNSDGKDNSLEMRKMGCAGMRFGRNFPRKQCQKPTEDELWNPSPRLVSQTFMSRKPEEFKPATTLNLLAAAWIQVDMVLSIRPTLADKECSSKSTTGSTMKT